MKLRHVLAAIAIAVTLSLGSGCATTRARDVVPSATTVQAVSEGRAEGVQETTRGASIVSRRYDSQGRVISEVSAQGFSAADTEQVGLTLDEQLESNGTVTAAFRLQSSRSTFSPEVAGIRASARVQLADAEGRWTGRVAEIRANERVAIVTEAGRTVLGVVDRVLPTQAAVAAGQQVLSNVLVRDGNGVEHSGAVLDTRSAGPPAVSPAVVPASPAPLPSAPAGGL